MEPVNVIKIPNPFRIFAE